MPITISIDVRLSSEGTHDEVVDKPGLFSSQPGGFVLPARGVVTVWVKAGAATGTELFLGRGNAVWNNDGDTAVVKDEDGTVVDLCSYGGSAVEAGCE